MKCHFEPPKIRKFGATPRRNRKSRRSTYNLYDENGLKRIGEKTLSRRAVYTKPRAPKFRRKQERIAQLRYTYIQMRNIDNPIMRYLEHVRSRGSLFELVFGTSEEKDAAKAKAFEEWKARWLANQRYLKPRLHPGGSPKSLFTGMIGRLESVNLITD